MKPQLIEVLKHGYAYNVTDGDEVRQELQAPNKYMREAADEIIKLMQSHERLMQSYQHINNERESLIKEVEELRERNKQVQVPDPNTPSD